MTSLWIMDEMNPDTDEQAPCRVVRADQKQAACLEESRKQYSEYPKVAQGTCPSWTLFSEDAVSHIFESVKTIHLRVVLSMGFAG